jgi:hypothetical protein
MQDFINGPTGRGFGWNIFSILHAKRAKSLSK